MVKNEKGLTLIELLAVMVVIGIIGLIAVASISGTIETSRKNADISSMKIIKSAGLRYAYTEDIKAASTVKTVTELINEGYLNEEPTFQSSDILEFGSVKIIRDSAGNYAVTVHSDESATTLLDESVIDSL